MFIKLRLQHFKSWVDTGEIRLAPLTAFFGANSSGKSSLLQALLLLKQTAESNDRSLVLKTGHAQDGYVNLGTIQEVIHGTNDRLSFALSWSADEELVRVPKGKSKRTLNPLSFSAEIVAPPDKPPRVRRFSYEAEQFSAEMDYQDSQYKLKVELDGDEPKRAAARPRTAMGQPQKFYGFSEEALSVYQEADYLRDLALALEKQLQRVYYLGPLRDYPQRSYLWSQERPGNVGLKGEFAVAALLAGKDTPVYEDGRGKKLEQRVAEWLKQLGLATSFQTQALSKANYEVRLKRTAESQEVLISDVGIGVSQVLPVLVLCYYAPKGSTLIFEQPELHLHPAVQAGLADVFVDVILKRQMQIILESHSEHLLRRLQRRLAEAQLKPDQVALYFTELAQGQSQIRSLDIDLFGKIRNWPPDFFGSLTDEMLAIYEASLKRQMEQG